MTTTNCIAPQTRKILLDFDGVVFRNRAVHDMVSHKSALYLHDRLKLRNMDQARVVCNTNYQIIGHTSLMIGDSPEHVKDYNNFVFDDLQWIKQLLTQEDLDHLYRLMQIKDERNLLFYLCTNAPYAYCNAILSELNIRFDDFFETSHLFTSDIGFVKPKQAFYKHVEDSDVCDGELHFIDDGLANILAVSNRDRWKAYYIKECCYLYRHLKSI